MRIIRDTSFLPPDDRGAAVAIGNFDGVHLGHQAVLKQTSSAAAGVPLGVMTFEPHPREFFARQHGKTLDPFRLMNADAKARRLSKLGVDRLYEISFTTALAELSDRDFARQILVDGMGVSHVVVGADFRFGKGRTGDAKTLAAYGAEMGFGVTISDMISTPVGEVSSTNIRAALTEGRPQDAAAMLGHWHRIEGEVIRGDQRGRELGYPTANMSIDGLHQPMFGVYAIKVDVLDGAHVGTYDGAASIGVRPMFGVNTPNCENFLFDFQGDLYGSRISVALVEFLRGEENFDSLDALITQMGADCIKAREILSDV